MNTEIFTALRDSGMAEEHATRVATAIPVSDDLATKADVRTAAHDLGELVHDLRSEMQRLHLELLKWMFISQSAFAGVVITLIKFL